MAAHSVEAGQGMPIQVSVNGRTHELVVEPHETLIELLRDRLGLTGTKKSCDMQVCGACTVLLNGRPVSSCTMLAFEARNAALLTIEGMARGETLHPIQEAFIEHGGLQCGFCTPGMILTAKALLDENPAPTEAEIKHYMRGNICRCTGYKRILMSIIAAARRMAEG
jgi:aerobic-type carbon monoxide dehydrogenase small subunit (CoxS/CutS family)